MEYEHAWSWVAFAYGVTGFALVLYASSIALRISRLHKKLGDIS